MKAAQKVEGVSVGMCECHNSVHQILTQLIEYKNPFSAARISVTYLTVPMVFAFHKWLQLQDQSIRGFAFILVPVGVNTCSGLNLVNVCLWREKTELMTSHFTQNKYFVTYLDITYITFTTGKILVNDSPSPNLHSLHHLSVQGCLTSPFERIERHTILKQREDE